MPDRTLLSRRGFLAAGQGLVLGAALAKPSLLWAAAPGDRRLVIIVLRGALDGMDMLRPYGDPLWSQLRPTLASKEGAPLELAPGFALHPTMEGLYPLWQRGELAFAPAVATPYRDHRSHFDGQDILENGTATAADKDDGWLNRALGALPQSHPKGYAVAIGGDRMLLLQGAEPALFWSPRNDLNSASRTNSLLAELYDGDPLFSRALSGAQEADVLGDQVRDSLTSGRASPEAAAQLAAEMLKGDARLAALSLGGWDTHSGQKSRLAKQLKVLANGVLALRDSLGERLWEQTLVMTMTEFGRTLAENGTRGTDHGTASVTLLAGGALRGGRLFGTWPGIGESDLYAGRDLMPTQDIRLYPAWALHAGYGIPRGALEREIFPGLQMGSDPGLT